MTPSNAKFGETRAAAKRKVCARCVFNGKMKKWQKLHTVFWIGGVGYGLLELLWRGETHWSMVLAGGACLVAICAVNKKFSKKKLYWRAAICAATITAVEFAVGLLVNLWWGLEVWDYSTLFGNIMGQICPLYSFLWFLLCLPVCAVVKKIGKNTAA